ncbi:MAG TPA: hypothetical protein VIV66_21105 [Pyrinomonadaceae bacterium]
MNYFNYFTEIEDAFVRRRGKHLLLSPLDWALIETWKQIGVPLHVVLRGIERSFDSWEARPRKRSVKSLLYCQEEVEAQYAEWLEARVGQTEKADEIPITASEPRDDSLIFSRGAVVEYLEHGRVALCDAAERRKISGEDELSEALERAALILESLTKDFSSSASPDTRRLEDSLTGLERMISDALDSVVSSAHQKSIEAEIVDQLRPYKTHMDKTMYQRTLDNLMIKRLREQFAVPRLSLFYL